MEPIRINRSIETDPKINDTYTLRFDCSDGYGANSQVSIEDFGIYTSGVAVFRQSRYDAGKTHVLKGDIARVCVTRKKEQYVKQYSGKNKVMYLIVYFKVIEIIVRSSEAEKKGKEFDSLYNEFFRPLRRKSRIINAYVDYYPRNFSKSYLREAYILGNVDKLDLEIIFREELD